jgi:hypothetical protein
MSIPKDMAKDIKAESKMKKGTIKSPQVELSGIETRRGCSFLFQKKQPLVSIAHLPITDRQGCQI